MNNFLHLMKKFSIMNLIEKYLLRFVVNGEVDNITKLINQRRNIRSHQYNMYKIYNEMLGYLDIL
jgi:hypothetical protein